MGARNAVEYFTGTGASDNDLLVTTTNVEKHSLFTLMSSAGAVDVEVTLDGTNWSTVALAMEDQGATANATYVIVTAANRVYKFWGKYRQIRVRQNGATAATATLMCGSHSG